ncbi:MAG: pentapeptide repeat-containing protein [Ktedonobacteraceae bacterium]
MNHQKRVRRQSKRLAPQPARPATNDRDAWPRYWQAQNQPWRTEPEIEPIRQEQLKAYVAVIPDIEKGIYPFKGVKLDRADVEWLIKNHENGYRPVDWNDERQLEHEGLDLCGADLREVDLQNLPLKRLRGSLALNEWAKATVEQREMATVLLEGANLSKAQLQGADLFGVRLNEATLIETQLDTANLRGAQMKQADLFQARLEGADLREAQLEGATLMEARLQGANLMQAQLRGADCYGARLEGANLVEGHLEGAKLTVADLEGAHLQAAYLEKAVLSQAQLQGADLRGAQLQGADLFGARLNKAILIEAQLEGINLKAATLSDRSRVGPKLVDAQWGTTNLAVVDWSQVKMLGDEVAAHQKEGRNGEKEIIWRRIEYEAAVRANRQLAVALQAQGLYEDSARFAYRAHILQRKVLWYQLASREQENKSQYGVVWQWLVKGLQKLQKFGSYVFSWFLDILAGYGYRPGRTLSWYLLVVLSYATVYFGLEHMAKLHLSFIGAIIFSVTAFHGRGFFPGGFGYDDPVTILAATEAVIGLLIELSFIATFTQRFFGK